MREASDVQSEISRAMARIRVAHEILARLVESDDDSIRELLSSRAESLGTRLTETTIGNQLRTGYRKLGFSDRRELKGWGTAVSGFIVENPPKD